MVESSPHYKNFGIVVGRVVEEAKEDTWPDKCILKDTAVAKQTDNKTLDFLVIYHQTLKLNGDSTRIFQ